MAATPAFVSKIDRSRVELGTPLSVTYWCAKLGASEHDIGRALSAVGHVPATVEAWLLSQGCSHIRPAAGPASDLGPPDVRPAPNGVLARLVHCTAWLSTRRR